MKDLAHILKLRRLLVYGNLSVLLLMTIVIDETSIIALQDAYVIHYILKLLMY